MNKKPTLRDIAREADVALSTVSQVMNNRPGVSPQMRQRVRSIAAELGYRPRIVVEGETASAIKTIGVLNKHQNGEPLLINPFYSYIIAGAERECARHGISLMYANIEVDEHSHALTMPAMLLDARVDGVVVMGALLEETLVDISERTGQNVVLVDSYSPSGNSFDRVLIDNIAGATSAVQYLVNKGHRCIGLIGSHAKSYPSILERRQGYMAVIDRHQLQPYIEDSTLSRQSAYEATQRLLNRAPEVTAIFACNDEVALGVMDAIHDHGLRIPQDISIVGFDDIDVAQELTPALTTMHVDKVLMGVMAVRHLLDRAIHPERTPLKTLVSTQLIERESVIVKSLQGTA